MVFPTSGANSPEAPMMTICSGISPAASEDRTHTSPSGGSESMRVISASTIAAISWGLRLATRRLLVSRIRFRLRRAKLMATMSRYARNEPSRRFLMPRRLMSDLRQ